MTKRLYTEINGYKCINFSDSDSDSDYDSDDGSMQCCVNCYYRVSVFKESMPRCIKCEENICDECSIICTNCDLCHNGCYECILNKRFKRTRNSEECERDICTKCIKKCEFCLNQVCDLCFNEGRCNKCTKSDITSILVKNKVGLDCIMKFQ